MVCWHKTSETGWNYTVVKVDTVINYFTKCGQLAVHCVVYELKDNLLSIKQDRWTICCLLHAIKMEQFAVQFYALGNGQFAVQNVQNVRQFAVHCVVYELKGNLLSIKWDRWTIGCLPCAIKMEQVVVKSLVSLFKAMQIITRTFNGVCLP